MLSAAFTLAIYGYLRVSEFTQPAHTQSPLPSRRIACVTTQAPLHHSPHSFQNRSVSSKAHNLHCGKRIRHLPSPAHEGQPLRGLQRACSSLCLSRWCSSHKEGCQQYLRYSLKHSGYAPQQFNSHSYSFRIDAVTTAAHSKMAQETIQ